MDRRRVLVVSAAMGGGHNAAAAELARRLRARGTSVQVVDLVALPRRVRGRALQRFYRELVQHAPVVYGAAMCGWADHPDAFERLVTAGSGVYERGLLAAVGRHRPHAVVATYNLAGLLLGRLRAQGRLAAPLAVYVTDPGPHPYWRATGADLHAAVLPETAAALRAFGAPDVRVVAPLVAPCFVTAADRQAGRRRLGARPDERVAVVSVGSWGVGAVERTVRRLAACPGVVPVTLCARDSGLLRRLQTQRLGRALGWTDDVAGVFAAADVVVDNAGGLTCWEALVAGLPVVLYRVLAGHGQLNAAALEQAGLAGWARGPAALCRQVLTASAPARAGELLRAPGMDTVVSELLR